MTAPVKHAAEPAKKAGPAALAAVLAVLVGLGVSQRVWTLRAVKANDPEEVKASLQRMPLRVGMWEGQEETQNYPEYPPGVLGPIRAIRYVNPASGDSVRILITAGPMGPILVNHLPTDCYPGIGYRLSGEVVRHTVSGADVNAQFWVGQFTKTDGPISSNLRVYWSFTGFGDWQAPESPRLAFARCPTIYKLYVVHALGSDHDPLDKDPANDFIRDLVPELRKTLFLGQKDSAAER